MRSTKLHSSIIAGHSHAGDRWRSRRSRKVLVILDFLEIMEIAGDPGNSGDPGKCWSSLAPY
eukprot:1361225-Amorphochlora_amoeboformis.AAC.1